MKKKYFLKVEGNDLKIILKEPRIILRYPLTDLLKCVEEQKEKVFAWWRVRTRSNREASVTIYVWDEELLQELESLRLATAMELEKE